MLEKFRAKMVGANGEKGVLERSGILVAIFVTAKILLDGWAAGDMWQVVEPQWETLQTLWITALLVIFGNKSKKPTP